MNKIYRCHFHNAYAQEQQRAKINIRNYQRYFCSISWKNSRCGAVLHGIQSRC